MFKAKDLEQFQKLGIDPALVEQQIKNFQQGFPFLKLNRAATINDGIVQLSEEKVDSFVHKFEENLPNVKVVKFVPASGAASRMFKALFSFMTEYKRTEEDYAKFVADKGFQSVYNFMQNIKNFAFYDELQETHRRLFKKDIEQAISDKEYDSVLVALLDKSGMQYGELPKGLLKFHKYPEGPRTPVEEHMVEGAVYGKDKEGVAHLHFTVSPEHRTRFQKLINEVRSKYEQKFKVKFDISFSEQRTATDTVAVDEYNQPFRENDETILFRPAGHGALIFNLNDIDADVIFIKNIDNVVPDRLKEPTFRYKKAIAGVLLHYRDRIFDYIEKLQGPDADKYADEVEQFLQKEVCTEPGEQRGQMGRKEYLLTKLNRPIRVCGMVKNEGEPGGGPFWAQNPDGTISLQVVESSQVNEEDATQTQIFKQATHFNPVDLVCYVRSHKGGKFNLEMFRDPEAGFISKKSKDGRELRAQELPGLWNGSMSDWNTIFVEVPIVTFNPVKTVNDLLREQHQ